MYICTFDILVNIFVNVLGGIDVPTNKEDCLALWALPYGLLVGYNSFNLLFLIPNPVGYRTMAMILNFIYNIYLVHMMLIHM